MICDEFVGRAVVTVTSRCEIVFSIVLPAKTWQAPGITVPDVPVKFQSDIIV